MAVPSYITLYVLNSQLLQIQGLSSVDDAGIQTPLNAATVTATLVDSDGKVADPTINAMALTYVSASSGNYEGTVDPAFNPPLGTYTLQIKATQGATTLYIQIPVSVQTRVK